ncbi:hypothetical protein Celaphus_00018563 [Cervus elaphus hippelaphus]|uniref:DH domain-containing protein n=1 Tax=Cervus elaphus hippelaphus TaxID=46360 RepID=A0A212CLQ9_CEREH|nr:hypothetical protein Celaphus_00018563 [Cervus elaphus hippelaphus]
MGSLMIKPIQRVMKYPLLLYELWNSTPASHPDFRALEHAYAAVKHINVNINELKRRKDLVLKYKKNDEEESLKDKLSKLNIHSISKKSKRVTNHLKILTRGESQDAMPLALQSRMELQEISHNKEEEESGYSESPSNAPNPSEDFAAHLQKLVLTPLSVLLSLFPGPQKLIQKRYDKLLDYNSYLQRAAADESDLAKREYEALNAQLVEELQVFNVAARRVLRNCLCSFVTRLRDLMAAAQRAHSATGPPEVPRQTDTHRSKLLSTYSTEELYQAKRKCNATQEYDINLLEGELVAVMEQKDPLGSTSRWLVDTGIIKGYVYSSFLKPYNPARLQKVDGENRFCDDDFDNISLFVSSRPVRDSVTGTPEGSISVSSSSLSGTCGKSETNGTDVDSFQEADEQVRV